jgi:hypothetical protein
MLKLSENSAEKEILFEMIVCENLRNVDFFDKVIIASIFTKLVGCCI